MTNLKLAIDISALGAGIESSAPRHGIYNVVENLLSELTERSDLDVTALGLCGNDPLASSIRAQLYFDRRRPALSCKFRSTFSVTPGLTGIYQTVFYSSLGEALSPAGPPRKGLKRATRAFLYRLYYQYHLARVRRVFDYRSFDVFHCPHLDVPPRDLTGPLPRVITIYDLIPALRSDLVPEKDAVAFRTKLEKVDISRDWIVSISEFTRREFCEYTHAPPERVLVAPLAASDSFRPITDRNLITKVRSVCGIPEGDYFLSLAAPQPRKNLAHLIRCFFRLLKEQSLPNTYLVLAGSKEYGWMYDEVFAAIESSNEYRSRIILPGYVADEHLAVLYSDATAFVFPSLYEGFGLPPLEAMACGAPVIVSNTSSLPEVVGDAGILVNPHDEDALCQAMVNILTSESLRLDLREKGLLRSKSFSWKTCAAKTVQAYRLAAAESDP